MFSRDSSVASFTDIPGRSGPRQRVQTMSKTRIAPPHATRKGAVALGAPTAQPIGLSEYCDTDGAAALLGISVSSLTKRRMKGDGPPFLKFSKLVRYHVPTLHAWAAARQHRSTSEYDYVA